MCIYIYLVYLCCVIIVCVYIYSAKRGSCEVDNSWTLCSFVFTLDAARGQSSLRSRPRVGRMKTIRKLLSLCLAQSRRSIILWPAGVAIQVESRTDHRSTANFQVPRDGLDGESRGAVAAEGRRHPPPGEGHRGEGGSDSAAEQSAGQVQERPAVDQNAVSQSRATQWTEETAESLGHIG